METVATTQIKNRIFWLHFPHEIFQSIPLHMCECYFYIISIIVDYLPVFMCQGSVTTDDRWGLFRVILSFW